MFFDLVTTAKRHYLQLLNNGVSQNNCKNRHTKSALNTAVKIDTTKVHSLLNQGCKNRGTKGAIITAVVHTEIALITDVKTDMPKLISLHP